MREGARGKAAGRVTRCVSGTGVEARPAMTGGARFLSGGVGEAPHGDGGKKKRR